MFQFSFVPIQNCVLGSLERLFTRCDHMCGMWNVANNFMTKGRGKVFQNWQLAHLNRDLNQVWEPSKPLPLSLYPGGPRNDCGRQHWSARPQGFHHHHCLHHCLPSLSSWQLLYISLHTYRFLWQWAFWHSRNKFQQFISYNYFPRHCHIEVTMASVIVISHPCHQQNEQHWPACFSSRRRRMLSSCGSRQTVSLSKTPSGFRQTSLPR